MKSIMLSSYNLDMGPLIDLEDEGTFMLKHIPGSINIPYDKLLYNKDRLLDKQKSYYLYCNGGFKSKRAVNILEAYGYKVTQVIIE